MKAGIMRSGFYVLIYILTVSLVGSVPQSAVGAAITGTVTFDGTPPPPKKIQVTKDHEKCGAEQLSEELLVGDGNGVQNVVVSIIEPPTGKAITALPQKVEIDQRGCRFIPHVVIMPAGGKLKMRNSDGISHNMHTFSKVNPAINKAQPGFKKTMTIRSLKKPETIRLQCDYHGWMSAWIVVTDNPYTVLTDATGKFELTDVPAGTYTLKLWHERLGETTQEVTVQEEAATSVQFSMGLQ